ncbi:hypothetical protein D3C84_1261550 [compost metagenome]
MQVDQHVRHAAYLGHQCMGEALGHESAGVARIGLVEVEFVVGIALAARVERLRIARGRHHDIAAQGGGI